MKISACTYHYNLHVEHMHVICRPISYNFTCIHSSNYCIVFINFYSASQSMSLSEALPTTAIDTVGVYTPKRYRQLQVKDFPIVPTWWLERDSKPRSFGRKASTLPMRHHNPQTISYMHTKRRLIDNLRKTRPCFDLKLSPDSSTYLR